MTVTLAVKVSQAAIGFKTFLVLFDYIVLMYLFFFNSWFRNRLIGVLNKIRED